MAPVSLIPVSFRIHSWLTSSALVAISLCSQGLRLWPRFQPGRIKELDPRHRDHPDHPALGILFPALHERDGDGHQLCQFDLLFASEDLGANRCSLPHQVETGPKNLAAYKVS